VVLRNHGSVPFSQYFYSYSYSLLKFLKASKSRSKR
jgi:hypothetical protein